MECRGRSSGWNGGRGGPGIGPSRDFGQQDVLRNPKGGICIIHFNCTSNSSLSF